MDQNREPILRLASIEDAPSVLAIYQAGDEFSISGDRYKDIGLADVVGWIESATEARPLLVVTLDDALIAWCAIEPFYGLPAFDATAEISLYVVPEWQGKGIGKRFITYLDAQKEHLAFSHLVAYVYARNTQSVRFFLGQNFKQWGHLPSVASFAGKHEDVLLLGRDFR